MSAMKPRLFVLFNRKHNYELSFWHQRDAGAATSTVPSGKPTGTVAMCGMQIMEVELTTSSGSSGGGGGAAGSGGDAATPGAGGGATVALLLYHPQRFKPIVVLPPDADALRSWKHLLTVRRISLRLSRAVCLCRSFVCLCLPACRPSLPLSLPPSLAPCLTLPHRHTAAHIRYFYFCCVLLQFASRRATPVRVRHPAMRECLDAALRRARHQVGEWEPHSYRSPDVDEVRAPRSVTPHCRYMRRRCRPRLCMTALRCLW
jgi:hypothetical protein